MSTFDDEIVVLKVLNIVGWAMGYGLWLVVSHLVPYLQHLLRYEGWLKDL